MNKYQITLRSIIQTIDLAIAINCFLTPDMDIGILVLSLLSFGYLVFISWTHYRNLKRSAMHSSQVFYILMCIVFYQTNSLYTFIIFVVNIAICLNVGMYWFSNEN